MTQVNIASFGFRDIVAILGHDVEHAGAVAAVAGDLHGLPGLQCIFVHHVFAHRLLDWALT